MSRVYYVTQAVSHPSINDGGKVPLNFVTEDEAKARAQAVEPVENPRFLLVFEMGEIVEQPAVVPEQLLASCVRKARSQWRLELQAAAATA